MAKKKIKKKTSSKKTKVSKNKKITKKKTRAKSVKKTNKKAKKKVTKKQKKKALKKPKKVFHLTWAFENFEEHDSFYTKRMFGGMAAYCHGKMVMLLAENPGDTSWRDQDYGFEIWNGILFPTDYELHESIQEEYSDLVSHPVLKKWMYLPLSHRNFESIIYSIAENISDKDERFGIFPKM